MVLILRNPVAAWRAQQRLHDVRWTVGLLVESCEIALAQCLTKNQQFKWATLAITIVDDGQDQSHF
jgi:hypothetical protein